MWLRHRVTLGRRPGRRAPCWRSGWRSPRQRGERDGRVVETFHGHGINGPWGMTAVGGRSVSALFVAGAGALFGLAVAPYDAGVYFVDDATNTLNLLLQFAITFQYLSATLSLVTLRLGSNTKCDGWCFMTVRQRTQVGIIGAGPAGLLLSHLLALAGIDSVLVESRSRAYCEARQRAGMLESTTVELLREVGLGRRLDAEGLEHDGIYLQFAGERHHVNFRELTNGRWVTIYAQTEIVKDLIAARVADQAALEFNVTGTAVSGLDSDRPVLSYTDQAGERHEVECDAIAGCDGFHGVTRPSIPSASLLTATERTYPYGWLGILAQAPPSTDEVIYCRHENGFALHSMRTPEIGRLYLQVPADENIERWPDERIWAELRHRMAVPGWELTSGPILEKGITPMRSFVAAPMRYRRLFLAGDAAHIVPPTGAKGLNLAVADVAALATALVRLVRDGRPELADAYSDHCLERVWRATHLACWMTTMLHVVPGQDDFESELQLAQLRNLVTSRAAATMLAENYTGYAPLRYDPATRLGPEALWASSVA